MATGIRKKECGSRKTEGVTAVDYRNHYYYKAVFSTRPTKSLVFITFVLTTSAMCALFSSFNSSLPSRVRFRIIRSLLMDLVIAAAVFNEYVNQHSLERLHSFLDKAVNDLGFNSPIQTEILKNATSSASVRLKIYSTSFLTYAFLMILAPPLASWLIEGSWKKLIFPWTFPPSEGEVEFWLVFIIQAISVVIWGYVAIFLMSYSLMTTQMTAVFEILINSIRNLEERAEARQIELRTNYNEALLACLREDIIFHQNLVRELVSITPHLRNTFFAISATVSIIMACQAVILMGQPSSADLIEGVPSFFIQIMCCGQICHEMELLADQNTKVFDALYNSPWYESGVKYKKLMLNAHQFARKPMHIKGRLFANSTATMATFYSIVMSAYNMFNTFRNLK